MDALAPVFRWRHVLSIAVSWDSLSFKKVAYPAIGGILLCRIENFLRRTASPPHYPAWFGTKAVLALMYGGMRRALYGVVPPRA